jgi:hypothetical protein
MTYDFVFNVTAAYSNLVACKIEITNEIIKQAKE